jgi:hypothetical protein
LAFVADLETQNIHLKTKFDMEHETSINHENGNDANRLLADVKTAKGRCIAKWEKRIEKAKSGMKRWGNGYGQTYQLEINIYEEVVKDLKRL